jgi:hypothetical protein
MCNTEDYPGPTKNQPDKKGRPIANPHPQATEDIVKPPAKKKGRADRETGRIPKKR